MTATLTQPPTTTPPTTTRIIVGGATLEVRTDLPEERRIEFLPAANAVIVGVVVENSFNGPSTVHASPATLLGYWNELIVDVHGLDDVNYGNSGYHWIEFERQSTCPTERLRSMSNNVNEPHRAAAANVLYTLTQRLYAEKLLDILKGEDES